MNKNTILNNAREFVAQRHKDDNTGHGYKHIERVVKTALAIQNREGGDTFLIALAAWLHDLEDYKLKAKSEFELSVFFQKVNLPVQFQKEVEDIINSISFSKSYAAPSLSLEAQIVQDADRLDAIGAIGVARAILYGGAKNRELYNYNLEVSMPNSEDSYKTSHAPTVHHFYHKLLLIKDRLNTNYAKELAYERHAFMLNFLSQLEKEVHF